jgi:uncharacterized membrane protein YqgA involved in biofilm formation
LFVIPQPKVVSPLRSATALQKRLCTSLPNWFSGGVLGTFINAGAIILGGILGLTMKKPLPANQQSFLKTALAVFTIFFGLRLVWEGFNGTLLQILAQLGIMMLAMILGRLTGRLLHLQHASNRLGQYARTRIAAARRDVSEGFNVCALLFCLAPLAWLGSVHDGLSGYFYPLAVKAVMDGLATMSFVKMFGWGAMMSALPVFALQGTLTLLCTRYALPALDAHSLVEHGLVNSVNATGGILISCVGLLIFELKKIPVTDYLPSLIFAPLLTWLMMR